MNPTDHLTLPQGWVSKCAQQLQALGPAIFDELAHDPAIELHNAWPKMDSAVAATEFFFPAQTVVLDRSA